MTNFFTGRWAKVLGKREENCGIMKSKFVFLIILFFASSCFAFECTSLFDANSPKKIDRPLLNAIKRIRNYGVFKNVFMVNTKTNRMTLIVFDIFNDGKIGERKSMDDHVMELREFASEIRYIYDSNTKDQILLSRLINNPNAKREENLHSASYRSISIIENLEKSETPEASYQFHMFQAAHAWLSKTGPQLNVLVLPESLRPSFIEQATNKGDYVFKTLEDIIISLDPEGSN